uniref:Uncharacterized protein n=1 Tax=Rhizophora mucronata TaxID=61149 RepID=A0A2P2PVL1_RHIMU
MEDSSLFFFLLYNLDRPKRVILDP